MQLMSYQRDGNIEGITKELGLSYEDSLIFLKEINEPRWVALNSKSAERDDLDAEELKKISEATKVFDYLYDFDSYYTDFIKTYNINLLKDDISFTEFAWLLNALLEDTKSNICQRLQYRQYKKSSGEDSDTSKFHSYKKDLYSITNTVSIDKIWGNVKKIGGN